MHADAAHDNPVLQSALERIYGLHRKEMDFRLESGPYRDLLIKLGNPQDKLPPVIHVAGTNGKGSTIAMLRALAEDAGMKVHVYTSPHLFRFNERLRVSGELIADDALLAAIEHVNIVNGDAPVTFFEFTSALMFHLFATYPADLCLIETGMGGRLDCTNVIDHPLATIITSIGFDHMEFLGDSIEQIAGEKAGIMKPNVPCFVAPQFHVMVPRILQGYAMAFGAAYHEAEVSDDTPQPGLSGPHQRENAATALMAFETLFPGRTNPKALQHVEWPGRFQKLSDRLIYDGAHNMDSARALADTVNDIYPAHPVTIILAMQAHKDPGIFIDAFKGRDVEWIATALPGGRMPQTAEALAKRLPNARAIDDMGDAIDAALQASGRQVIVSGSLYAAQLIPNRFWHTIKE